MFRVAVVLTSAVAATDSAPNSLAWKPNAKDDAQLLIASYDAANVEAEAHLASDTATRQKLSLAKKQVKKPLLKLAHVHSSAVPKLDQYLSSHRQAGAAYSTQWKVTPKKNAHGQVQSVVDKLKELEPKKDAPNRYLDDLYGMPVAAASASKQTAEAPPVDQRAPSNAGVPFSKLISGDMREVVVQAQRMLEDKQKAHGPLSKVLKWSKPLDQFAKEHVLASNAQMTSHVEEAKTDDANPYMHFLASREDQVVQEAADAEKQANRALRHSGETGGYMPTILSDEYYVSLAK